MALGVAFGLMGAFFMAGLYVAAALGCLSLVIMWFFSRSEEHTSELQSQAYLVCRLLLEQKKKQQKKKKHDVRTSREA